jgi:hypothetical protein
MQMRSAYDAELLGLAMASWASTTSTVYCDCESAIKAVKEFHSTGRGDARQSAALGAMRKENVIRKVKAHAERRGGPRDSAERGNCIADALARGQAHEGVTVRQVEDQEVKKIFSQLEFLLTTEDDVDPDWRRLRQDLRLREYLRARDGIRAASGRVARWQGTTTRLAGLIVRQADTLLQRARFVRTIWDKQAHLGNRANWGLITAAEAMCGTCGAREDQRHIIMQCCNPGISQARAAMMDVLRAGCEAQKTGAARRVMRKIEDLIMHHPLGHTILTGLMAPEIRDAIRAVDTNLSDQEYRAVAGVIQRMYHCVDQMYLSRARWGTEERREQREDERMRRRRRRQRQAKMEEYIYVRRRIVEDRRSDRDEEEQRDCVCPQDKRQWDQ